MPAHARVQRSTEGRVGALTEVVSEIHQKLLRQHLITGRSMNPAGHILKDDSRRPAPSPATEPRPQGSGTTLCRDVTFDGVVEAQMDEVSRFAADAMKAHSYGMVRLIGSPASAYCRRKLSPKRVRVPALFRPQASSVPGLACVPDQRRAPERTTAASSNRDSGGSCPDSVNQSDPGHRQTPQRGDPEGPAAACSQSSANCSARLFRPPETTGY